MSLMSVHSINVEKRAYRGLVGKPEQNRLTGRLKHRGEDIKMDLQ
jgi:hypothetical protein